MSNNRLLSVTIKPEDEFTAEPKQFHNGVNGKFIVFKLILAEL